MKKVLLLVIMSGFASQSFAAVSGYHEGQISEVGYEAGRGLIRLDTSISDGGCTGAYADLSDEGQRVAYSTALAAKMAGARVKMRFEVGGTTYYSYCKVFQLTVMPSATN